MYDFVNCIKDIENPFRQGKGVVSLGLLDVLIIAIDAYNVLLVISDTFSCVWSLPLMAVFVLMITRSGE